MTVILHNIVQNTLLRNVVGMVFAFYCSDIATNIFIKEFETEIYQK